MNNNIFSIRDKCVICNTDLDKCLYLNDYLIPSNPSTIDEEFKSIHIPYNILICKNCGIYQNKYLGNVNIVYDVNHNNLLISKLWIEHYNIFYSFIKKNIILKIMTVYLK